MNESPTWQSFDAFISTTDSNRELPIQDSDRFVSYSLNDLYPEWQALAHCSGVGVNYYFGDEEQQPTMSIKQVRRAAKLCDVCPVYVDCLRHALENREEYGVWAGTSGRVRRRIFQMVENGETTVDDVVEDFTHGRRQQYLGSGSGRRDQHPTGGRMEPEVAREIAL